MINVNHTKMYELGIKEAGEIYQNHLIYDFPKEEVKPLINIIRMMEEGAYKVYGVFEEVPVNPFEGQVKNQFDLENLSAYAFVCLNKENDYMLLDYFAVVRGKRGCGYGTLFLNQIKEKIKDAKALIIETEVTDFAEGMRERLKREKRDNFYKNGGAFNTGLIGKVYDASYTVWYLPITEKELDLEGYTLIYDDFYKYMLSEDGYKNNYKVYAI